MSLDEDTPRMCANCEFWHRGQEVDAEKAPKDPGRDSVGVCAEAQPTVSVGEWGVRSFWPRTHASRVCGNHSDFFKFVDPDDPDGGERAPVDNVRRLPTHLKEVA